MSRAPRAAHHLIGFRIGDIFRKYAAYASPLNVNFEHDLGGSVLVFSKKLLDRPHDKLHRCVIVVQQDHLVQTGGLGPLRQAVQYQRIVATHVGGAWVGYGGRLGCITHGVNYSNHGDVFTLAIGTSEWPNKNPAEAGF